MCDLVHAHPRFQRETTSILQNPKSKPQTGKRSIRALLKDQNAAHLPPQTRGEEKVNDRQRHKKVIDLQPKPEEYRKLQFKYIS